MEEEKTVVRKKEEIRDPQGKPPVQPRKCRICGAPLPSNVKGNICFTCSIRK